MENKELLAKKKNIRKERAKGLVSLALLPVTVIYNEIMLKLMPGSPFTVTTTIGMILIAAATGMIFNLFCLIPSSRKVSRWLCFGFAEATTIFFLLMHFVNDSFRVFMDPISIAIGTGNAVNTFFITIISLIAHGIPTILLFHVPALVILYLAIRDEIDLTHKGKWQPIVAAILLVVFAASGPFVHTADESAREKYTSEYTFDTSVRTFGLVTSLKLDSVYRLFGNPFEAQGFVLDPDSEQDKPWEDDPAGEQTDVDPTDADPVEDDPIEDDPIEDDPVEDDPIEEEPIEEEPTPVEYGWNVMDIDFDSLIASAPDQTVKSLHQYAASLTPSRQNEFTGLFEGKNLILITAEAFSKEVIDEEMTPALYRMANKGIVFEDYYQPAWGGSTSTGEFSVITGIVPANKIYSVKQSIGYNFYMTMGSQLMRLGYDSGAYHNGSYTFYDRNLTHTHYGYSKFIAMGNGMENGVENCWPESDEEMFKYIMPEYIESGNPFSLYFMTVSGHCAYSVTGNTMSRKHYDKFASTDASEVIKCYRAANYELELSMEYLINALEEAGIADDTVIVISTDHYPYGLEESATWGTTKSYLPELYGFNPTANDQRDHSALIIWSGCLEDREEPIVVSTPTYSIDVLPTLSNLFGVEYDSRLLIGRDVFSDEEALVLWPDYSWKTEKGYFHGPSGVFWPAEGAEYDGEYVERIKSVVRNKITFSKGMLNYDYFNYIFKK